MEGSVGHHQIHPDLLFASSYSENFNFLYLSESNIVAFYNIGLRLSQSQICRTLSLGSMLFYMLVHFECNKAHKSFPDFVCMTLNLLSDQSSVRVRFQSSLTQVRKRVCLTDQTQSGRRPTCCVLYCFPIAQEDKSSDLGEAKLFS